MIKIFKKIIQPVLYYVGKITWRLKRPYNISPEEVKLAMSAVSIGDVILTYKKYNLTNYTIPGKWDHAAIITSPAHGVEAIGKGVVLTPLLKLLANADHILILKPTFCDISDKYKAGKSARELVGLPYDYDFEFSLKKNKAFYCSEVIWYCYEKALDGKSPFKPREVFGELTIIPSDFANARDKWEEVIQIGHRD